VVTRFVDDFVRTQDLESLSGCLVIADAGRIRIRRRSGESESNK
jgi:hypothetical protein